MDAEISSAVDVAARPGRPWLIVGKGPSLDAADAVSLSRDFRTFTLNHACRVVLPTIAHFTDLEAFQQCAEGLLSTLLPRADRWVCLPWWPHVRFRPGRVNLAAHATPGTALGELRAAGRLCSYNSTLAWNLPRNRALPEVRVRYFSAVAAFNVLVRSGQRTLYSVGVDGGTQYAAPFAEDTRLANGRASFDIQHAEIEMACKRHNVVHTRLRDQGGPR